MNAYDKTRRRIKVGDILKVHHYTIGSRKKYMYKQVLGMVFLGRFDPAPFLKVGHLNMNDEDYYHVLMDGTVLPAYEIVASRLHDHEDRERKPK